MEKKLAASQNEEPAILAIIRSMMFVYGDSEHPLERCEIFVLDLVKHQLVQLANGAFEVAQKDKSPEIRLKDLFYVMRHQAGFIARLLRYAQAAQRIAEVTRETEDEENSTKNKNMEGAYFSMMDAIKAWDLNITAETLEQTEPYFEQRQKRMANRVSDLNGKQYERFTEARKVNFCNGTKKGSRRFKDSFMTWLGSPPLARFSDFVLAFVARETVASITDDAATLRAQEPKGWFLDDGFDNALQMRHFEQALRRNLIFRRTGNYLFGALV